MYRCDDFAMSHSDKEKDESSSPSLIFLPRGIPPRKCVIRTAVVLKEAEGTRELRCDLQRSKRSQSVIGG